MLTRLFALAGASALVAGIVIGCGTDAVQPSANDDGGTNNPPDGGKPPTDSGTPATDSGAPSDGGDAGPTPVETFAVGGTVSGISGTGLVLQNNGADDLPVNANGTFAFPKKLAKGASFTVTVKNQPTAPMQTCTVTAGSGTIGGNVSTVLVNCDTNKFAVSGHVSGLAGGSVVLENNGGDDVTVNGDGDFAFATTVADGAAYAITVKTQPAGLSQTCTVSNGSGNIAAADVTNVDVVCVTNKFTIGGTVTGLTGSGLVLQNNNGDDYTVASDGTFTFAASQFDGTNFAVSIKTQPTGPVQTCSVVGGSGTLAGGNVSSVVVNCSTNTYTVSGKVSGLEGGGLVLQNNAGDDVPITLNGDFAFSSAIADLAAYSVTVKTQPTNKWQTCTVTNGSGNIAAAPVSNVSVVCTTNTYKVKATVTGLEGNGLVLQNYASDSLPIANDGTFEFTTPVASGDGYFITVLSNPDNKSQTCTVSNPTGSVAGSDVTNITVACVTNKYSVGGSVTGLVGSGLVLQNNAGDDFAVTGDGDFTFGNELESGANFAVTVKTQPSGPSQQCIVTGGTGTVASGNVVSVSINCTTNKFTVGGKVTGLSGSGLVLQRNGLDMPINSNGDFAFPAQLDGAPYFVTVKTQPTTPSQTCTVSNGSGSLAGSDVTDVSVSCTTNTYLVGGTLTNLGAETIVLQNNNGDDLTLTANGPFNFLGQIASGAPYSVTVKTQPATQTCTVTNGTGTVIAAAITNVSVTCTCPVGTLNSNGNCILAPSGGTITNIGGYRIHTFLTGGSFVAPSNMAVEYLIVGGGGGGGSGDGAGGGAGGFLTGSTSISASTFTVVVGAGGAGAGFGEVGSASVSGSNSSFAGFIAIGGGRGGQEGIENGTPHPLNNGGDGGSGGGFGGANPVNNGAPGNGTNGQGHKGGVRGSTRVGIGGGGGAGADGGNGFDNNAGGNGGAGLQSSISGTATYYAGGGGGSGRSVSGGLGGLGGGGKGGLNASGTNGTANTGGGGGGGGDQGTTGGAGGSGIVIIRYPVAP